MKTFLDLFGSLCVGLFAVMYQPLWLYGQDEPSVEQQQDEETDFSNVLRDLDLYSYFMLSQFAFLADSGTPEEHIHSSRRDRLDNNLPRGFANINDVAEYVGFSNMERLEFLKYLLDQAFIPLPPYMTSDYFPSNDDGSVFPTNSDLADLEYECRNNRPWPCNHSPVSFIRLALASTPFLQELGSKVVSYSDLEGLFEEYGYSGEDFSQKDLEQLGWFLRQMGYIPLWPDQRVSQRIILNVTDDTFQKDVLDVKDKLVIVYFHASWCRPCHTMTPMMEELAIEFNGDFLLAKVYSDGNVETATMHLPEQVIPAIVGFYNGEKVAERLGFPRIDPEIYFGLNPEQEAEIIKSYYRRWIEGLVWELSSNGGFVRSKPFPQDYLRVLEKLAEIGLTFRT